MIYVGIDDTDMPGTPGTNKFARALTAHLSDHYRCTVIVRHQLLQDPRIPCTSKNSSASILLEPVNGASITSLIDTLRDYIRSRLLAGSDPGFCVTATVPDAISVFGARCKQELVTQSAARQLAAKHNIHLEGCGGTEDGVIGALAAVGLIVDGNDGRVVQTGNWPDDLSGIQEVTSLRARGVEVRSLEDSRVISTGIVDVGKHLRPSYREQKIVLIVEPLPSDTGQPGMWRAMRLT